MTNTNSSKWRQRFRVHPAADLFPMMSAEELAKTGASIKKNGLKLKIDVRRHGDDFEAFDGRNRLEAMERAGIDIDPDIHFNEMDLDDDEVLAHVIAANIQRRHLTPGEVADLVVKLAKIELEKTGPRGPVCDADITADLDRRGGRGKKSRLKEKAVEMSQAMPEEARPSERTIKRAIAKSEGQKPKKKVKPAESRVDSGAAETEAEARDARQPHREPPALCRSRA